MDEYFFNNNNKIFSYRMDFNMVSKANKKYLVVLGLSRKHQFSTFIAKKSEFSYNNYNKYDGGG